MGKLILCSGARAKTAYVFRSTGIRVYSMEELCYYLYNHIYLIEEEIYHDALIDWIDQELQLTERAEKLRLLKKQKADVKTIITVILCSTDYYTELEIKGMLKRLDEIIRMPKSKRACMKANYSLNQRKYSEAAAEYEKLLQAEEAKDLSPEDYGDILHNLAVAKLHITGFKEASELFRQAYERNQKEESLKQYLYTLKLSGNDDIYQRTIDDYQLSDELKQTIEDFINEKMEEIKYTEQMIIIQSLKQLKEKGQMMEYYRQTEELIEGWKSEIRK
jgi:tetratricopeptide (TPR) repeat protein